MVFVFFQFERPPLFFNPVEVEKVKKSAYADQYQGIEQRYEHAADRKANAAKEYVEARRLGDDGAIREAQHKLVVVSRDAEAIRSEGIEVLKAMRDENLKAVVIVLTNYPYAEYRQRAKALGAQAFLHKSSDFERVPALLHRLLTQASGAGPADRP
jgi:DNA-binding NarL/FixJ family response regulator